MKKKLLEYAAYIALVIMAIVLIIAVFAVYFNFVIVPSLEAIAR